MERDTEKSRLKQSKNEQSWLRMQGKIFPNGLPTRFEWNKPNDIVDVLRSIGKMTKNQFYFPTGGSSSIKNSSLSQESNCIEILTDQVEIVKPIRLTYYSFVNCSSKSFFYLETESLQPTGIYEEVDFESEELVELLPGKYISRYFWDENEYEGQQIPSTARLVTRHLRGSFVIFSSSYNGENIDLEDGGHDLMSADEFYKTLSDQNSTSPI